MLAAPWVPHASLDDGAGRVAPEFLWAALDCAGAFAVMEDLEQPIILGELSARLDGELAIGEPCGRRRLAARRRRAQALRRYGPLLRGRHADRERAGDLDRAARRSLSRRGPQPAFARSSSCSRSTRRCTLPVVVIGSASMNSISFGYS